MMIFEITPDKMLAEFLSGRLTVRTSETTMRKVKAYRQSAMPNIGLADEFLTVTNNGVIRAKTYPIGVFRGNLAVTIYCKANSNGTAKHKRISSLLEQVQSLIENRIIGGFYYEFNADNVITPTTVNATTGYAMTVVNLEWRTNIN